MSRRSRNATIISTALVALALVAGCGGAAGTPTAEQPPGAVAAGTSQDAAALLEGMPEATFAAGSARYEMQLNVTAQGQTIQAAGSGSYDFAKRVGTMSLDGAFIGMPGQVESVMDGDTVYMRFPGQPGWFRTSAGSGALSGQYDPARQLEVLRTASSDLRVVGTEQLRGDEVQHIAFTFDPRKAAGTLGQAGAAAAMAPAPADVWVDSEGRARKFHLKTPVTQNGVSAETDTTIEYFDFGAPVTVQVPDPAQVQDMPTPR